MNLTFLYIAIPFWIDFILKCHLGISGIPSIVTVIFMPLPFFILTLLFYKKTTFLKNLFSVLIYFPIFINISHILLFNSEISCGSFMAMFETNIQESLEFFEHFFSFNLLLFVTTYWLIWGILYKFSYTSKLKLKLNKKMLWTVFIVLYSIFCFGDQRYKFPFEKILFTFIEYKIDSIKNKNALKDRENFSFENVNSFIDKNEKELYIIIIGESANKDHMSLYGNKLKTTPKFDSIKDELYIFSNVKSKYCTTYKAMKTILFFDEQFQNGDLITLFKQAGFKTFWFSNQCLLESDENISALAGKLADEKEFINRSHYRTKLSSNYDEKLIEYVQKAVLDKANKKAIFVHLIGSHFPYAKRYPAEFDVFKSKENIKRLNEIAEYDNSILYTDHVLEQILNIIKSQNTNSYMLYFSDHGEDITEDPKSPHTHVESLSTKPMFEIPFIVWVSEKYEALNKKFVRNWDTKKEYNTGDVIHSIINLSRLICDRYNESKSIFSKDE